MEKRYLRTDTQSVLAHTVEECGELVTAIGKTQRWGLDSYDPTVPESQRETNRDWIRREMKDARLALARLELLLDGNL